MLFGEGLQVGLCEVEGYLSLRDNDASEAGCLLNECWAKIAFVTKMTS